jgi:DNA-directed RNA polymerase subunit M/transcription elongation factor TFIIS
MIKDTFPYFREKTLNCLIGHPSICAKLEVIIYNNVVTLFKDCGIKTIEKQQFISLYNFHSQRLLFSMKFIMPLIEKRIMKPSQVISKIGEFCHNFDEKLALVTLEDDLRITLRWFMLRKLGEYFKDKAMVREMEDSIHRHKMNKKDYKSQCFLIISNIRNKKTNFHTNLVRRNISLDIGCMTHKDIWPQLWAMPNMQPGHKAQVVYQDQESTDESPSLIQCHSCKQYKVTYYEMQTRSADEPMTCFCTCLNCGKKWKM